MCRLLHSDHGRGEGAEWAEQVACALPFGEPTTGGGAFWNPTDSTVTADRND